MARDVFGIVGTTQAGAFKVREVVAEGGFAVVYRARHKAFRSNVALKCLKIPTSLSEAEQKGFLRAFREEAELLFRLSAAIPAVVRPLQAGKLSGASAGFAPFLALEWLRGRTLSRFLDERTARGVPPPRLSQIMRLLAPVAEALDRAHDFPTPAGRIVVVHCDLKPDNIFVADVGGRRTVKILDFGIAKAKSVAHQLVGEQSVRASDFAAFTPAYAAPEQWNPKRYGQTGAWTDVWGLAMVMVECVYGAPIDRGEPAEFMARALNPHERPTPRSLGVEVSDAVEQVFQKALAMDPRDRFQHVAEFWTALLAAVGRTAEKLPQLVFSASTSGNRSEQEVGAAVAERRRNTITDSEDAISELDSSASPEAAGGVPSLRFHPRKQVSVAPQEAADSERESKDAAAATHSAGDASSSEPFSVHKMGRQLTSFTAIASKVPIELDAPVRVRSQKERPRLNDNANLPVTRKPPADEVNFKQLRQELGWNRPLALTSLGIGLMGLDWAARSFTGEPLPLGPIRMLWIAGPLVAAGLITLLLRVVRASE